MSNEILSLIMSNEKLKELSLPELYAIHVYADKKGRLYFEMSKNDPRYSAEDMTYFFTVTAQTGAEIQDRIKEIFPK